MNVFPWLGLGLRTTTQLPQMANASGGVFSYNQDSSLLSLDPQIQRSLADLAITGVFWLQLGHTLVWVTRSRRTPGN